VSLSSPQLEVLTQWWTENGEQLVELRRTYRWPARLSTEESLSRREEVAQLVRDEAARSGRLTRPTVEAVLKWGFNNDASVLDALSDDEIRRSTADAIGHLRADRIVEAAVSATRPYGIGISRASKFLALTDESRFGIYDSRVGRGLAEYRVADGPVVEVPPGRGEPGTTTNGRELARAFAICTEVLRRLAALAAEGPAGLLLQRPSDVEMALFMRGARTR
jgi:hypothetical protein